MAGNSNTSPSGQRTGTGTPDSGKSDTAGKPTADSGGRIADVVEEITPKKGEKISFRSGTAKEVSGNVVSIFNNGKQASAHIDKYELVSLPVSELTIINAENSKSNSNFVERNKDNGSKQQPETGLDNGRTVGDQPQRLPLGAITSSDAVERTITESTTVDGQGSSQ